MNLYLISQSTNTGYDTYDSAVVVAPDAETAQLIVPRGIDEFTWDVGEYNYAWANSWDDVKVTYIGKAAEHLKCGEVVCASFNAD